MTVDEALISIALRHLDESAQAVVAPGGEQVEEEEPLESRVVGVCREPVDARCPEQGCLRHDSRTYLPTRTESRRSASAMSRWMMWSRYEASHAVCAEPLSMIPGSGYPPRVASKR